MHVCFLFLCVACLVSLTPPEDLSVDAMDISGEHQLDVSHNIYKKRLSPDGQPMVEAPPIKDAGEY